MLHHVNFGANIVQPPALLLTQGCGCSKSFLHEFQSLCSSEAFLELGTSRNKLLHKIALQGSVMSHPSWMVFMASDRGSQSFP